MAAYNYRFAESDSLLCYHGKKLYEAKCLKRRKANDGKPQYFIHYKGWSSKWEEWVDDNRVLSVSAANMDKIASLEKRHSNTKKSEAKRSNTKVKEETICNVLTPPIKGKKRKYSEISSEFNQIVNVPPPTEPKPIKRGRPRKIITSKIEETKPTKSVATTIVTETELAESIDENKVIDKATKEEDTEIENVEGNESIAEFEAKDHEAEEFESEDIEGEELQAYDGTEEFEESTNEETFSDEETDNEKDKEYVRMNSETYMRIRKEKELEEAKRKEETDNKFTVPSPVVKITPKINIPDVIKRRIAFDFKMVVNNNQILKFSKTLTIYRLIEDFQNSDPDGNKIIGLTFIQFFNFFIHKRLLYGPEKKIKMRKKASQMLITYMNDGEVFKYSNNSYPKKLWHLVYGPSYLIRLFVLLPKIVASSDYFEEDIPKIIEMFEVFMKFIAVNFDQYFSDESQDYIVNK